MKINKDIYDTSSETDEFLAKPLSFKFVKATKNKKFVKKLPLDTAFEKLTKSFHEGIITPIKFYQINCIPEFTGQQLNYKSYECPQKCPGHGQFSTYLSHFPKLIDLVTIEDEMYILRDDFKSKKLIYNLFLYFICQNDFKFLKQNYKKYLNETKEEIDTSVFEFLEKYKNKNHKIQKIMEEIEQIFELINDLEVDTKKLDLTLFVNKIDLESAFKDQAREIVKGLIYNYQLEMLLVNLFPMKMNIRIDHLYKILSIIFNIPSVDCLNFKTKIFDLESKNIKTKITKNSEYGEIHPLNSLSFQFYGDLESLFIFFKRNGLKEGDFKKFEDFNDNFLLKKVTEIYEIIKLEADFDDFEGLNEELNKLYPNLVDLMDCTYKESTFKENDRTVDLTNFEILWYFYFKEIENTDKEIGNVCISVQANGKNAFNKHHQ